MREACDDGNALDDDACSSACTPTILVVDAAAGNAYAASALGTHGSIGVDGTGALLFVGTREGPDGAAIVARRANSGGAFIVTDGAPFIVIDADVASPESASPAVMGLPSGWLVVWASPRRGVMEIVAEHVRANGTLGVRRVVNTARAGDRGEPSVVVLEDEIVIAWTERRATNEDPFGGVRARRYSLELDPRGTEIMLATSVDALEHDVSLASIGSTWIAAWVRRGGALDAPQIALRRFNGSVAIDADDSSSFMAGVAADDPQLISSEANGLFVLSFRSMAFDAAGDVAIGLFLPNDLSVGDSYGISEAPNVAERALSLASSPNGEVLGTYETSTPSRVVAIGFSASEQSELTTLVQALAGGGYDHGSVVAGPRGFWITWSGTLPGQADRCMLAFSIPYGASQ